MSRQVASSRKNASIKNNSQVCGRRLKEQQKNGFQNFSLKRNKPVFSFVSEVLRSPGEPLDPAIRALIEPKLGYDFSKVRIHADEKSSDSAKKLHARAFALGHNIVFDRLEYSPRTNHGMRLLAHELAHVVQQADQPISMHADLSLGNDHDSYEKEADMIADRLLSSPGTVRQPLVVRRKSPGNIIRRTPIFTGSMDICHNYLQSRRFHLSEGGLVVTAMGDWVAPEWQGPQPPQCGPSTYSLEPRQIGSIVDSPYGSCQFPIGRPFTRRWTNLPVGDYYIDINVFDHNPVCCLRGNIEVSQQRGLSGETCTQMPPGPLEILHDALAAAGLIPGLGAIPDTVDTGIYIIQGDWTNAGFSAAAIIPVFGDAASVGRIGARTILRVEGRAVSRIGREGIATGLREARAGQAAGTHIAEGVVHAVPRARDLVSQALRSFVNRYFNFGNVRLLLTRERMEHILLRHHPNFWDGSTKASQTFFNRRLSVDDIGNLIRQTLEANRERIIREGANGAYQITHEIEGTTYVLGVTRGHIGQFYPL